MQYFSVLLSKLVSVHDHLTSLESTLKNTASQNIYVNYGPLASNPFGDSLSPLFCSVVAASV